MSRHNNDDPGPLVVVPRGRDDPRLAVDQKSKSTTSRARRGTWTTTKGPAPSGGSLCCDDRRSTHAGPAAS
jgi:hypothetical protein